MNKNEAIERFISQREWTNRRHPFEVYRVDASIMEIPAPQQIRERKPVFDARNIKSAPAGQ